MSATTDRPNLLKTWDFSDPAASEQKFKDLLHCPAALEDNGFKVEILTQVARAQGLQRKFDEAKQTLKDAREFLSPEAAKAEIRYKLELGRVHNSSGEKEPAKLLFLEAFNLAKDANEDFLAVDAAHMVAIADPDPKAQLEWNEIGIALADRSTDPDARGWLGSLLNNTAWTYHGSGDYEKALDLFQRALAFREEQQGNPANIRIARWCVARCLRSLGRVEEALARQRDIEKACLESNQKLMFTAEEIAECLLELGKPQEAKPYFAIAYEELSQDRWLPHEEPERLARMKELSQ